MVLPWISSFTFPPAWNVTCLLFKNYLFFVLSFLMHCFSICPIGYYEFCSVENMFYKAIIVSPCASDEEMAVMDEGELSSDEEKEDDDEVALIILKRLSAIVRTWRWVEDALISRLRCYVFFFRLLSRVRGRGLARPPSLPRSRQEDGQGHAGSRNRSHLLGEELPRGGGVQGPEWKEGCPPGCCCQAISGFQGGVGGGEL